MDKRQFKRKIVTIKADISFGDLRCAGIIENISLKGLYAVVTPTDSAFEFSPGSAVDVHFDSPAGERQHLRCRIKWSYKTPPHQLTSSIGMEITEAPSSFSTLLDSLE